MRIGKSTIIVQNGILLFLVLTSILIIVYPLKDNADTVAEIEDYSLYFPPKLSKDFYPNNLTREKILARLHETARKTGLIAGDEEWKGVLKITGDLRIALNATVNIEPGTIVFVATRSDDQKTGVTAPKDLFNPKAPVRDEEYVKKRVMIVVDGILVAEGTREQPIIITSDSPSPQTDDWDGISVTPEGRLSMNRVVMEYLRILGISSSSVNISQSILRNMMGSIVIMGEGENLIKISPVLTQNYIYNIGQFCITVRSGSPVITHNIIRPRQDMGELNLPGFEYGGVAVDHPAIPIIEHNFFEGTGPARYDEYDIWGRYHEFIEPTGLCTHASIAPSKVANNTFYNFTVWAMESFPAPVTIENNNFMNNSGNLVIHESLYEPSDIWQIKLFEEGVIKPIRVYTISAQNNYWGNQSEEEVDRLIQTNQLVEVEFKPFRRNFIKDALPNWQEFSWGVLQRSAISLEVSSRSLDLGQTITVSGSISPSLGQIQITLAFTRPDSSTISRSVRTSPNGSFTDISTPDQDGQWSAKASWSGNENYLGAESQSFTFTVKQPFQMTYIVLAAVVFGVAGGLILTWKKIRKDTKRPADLP